MESRKWKVEGSNLIKTTFLFPPSNFYIPLNYEMQYFVISTARRNRLDLLFYMPKGFLASLGMTEKEAFRNSNIFNSMQGKFIVFYGINNLGKTTQAKMLADYFNKKNIKAEYLKYPIYDLEPTGKLINEYLRGGNPYNFSPRELQLLHYTDRIAFEPILKSKLNNGINIIAEDYFGTAVAWGVGAGVDRGLLEYLYSFIYKEDLAILFDGERFAGSIEKNHKHENDSALTERVRQVHLELAEKYNWEKINANQPIEKVREDILRIVTFGGDPVSPKISPKSDAKVWR